MPNIGDDVGKFMREFRKLAFELSKLNIPLRRDVITLEKLPWYDFPGVYIIHFEKAEFIYIGSSMNAMGSAVWGNGKVNRKTCCWDGDVVNGKKATFVDYIKLDDDIRFFAPGFESLLIDRMGSSGYKLVNKKG
jgi:hypothetical protein